MTKTSGESSLFGRISRLIQPFSAYLVGGAVRDKLLGIPTHDLDFALPERTLQAAKLVADQLGGAYYVLDEQRNAARVVVGADPLSRQSVDFTTFQGPDLIADLKSRDFTITAMAVDLDQPDILIDPLGGAADLRRGVIKSCSPCSIEEDPIRALRAVRMAVDFNFRIQKETQNQIRDNVEKLERVSPERLRDEVFRMITCKSPAAAFRVVNTLGITPQLFPGAKTISSIRIQTLVNLEKFWKLLGEEYAPGEAADLISGQLVTRLGRYRDRLSSHLNNELVWERNVRSLINLAGLSSDPGDKDSANDLFISTIDRFKLSTQEKERLILTRQAAEVFRSLPDAGSLAALDAYRYFRAYSAAGIDGVFLALADYLSETAGQPGPEGWRERLDRARFLLESWWEKTGERVSPPVLVDGHLLMAELELEPGPIIGELLENIREAQVKGQVSTAGEALERARKILEG
ncbi:MAG: hypothetical protein U5K99_03115 [Anaerolineales bacterium]|nr:hypothetical protein [Anaerolineales bacterium]